MNSTVADCESVESNKNNEADSSADIPILPGSDSNSKSSAAGLCSFCPKSQPSYVCPRCAVAYCSLACYRHTDHLHCTELFHKTHVDDELALRDHELRNMPKTEENKKFLKKLTKFARETDFKDGDEENVDFDSDDDDPGDLQYLDQVEQNTLAEFQNLDLSQLDRELTVKGVSLDSDATQLLSKLTEAERRKFQQICESFEFDENEKMSESVFRK